jgi:MinD superfamily P-loop ATPase
LIISVASGKGGTGKTSVAVSLARSLEYCQFLDFDVEAPNSRFFLKPDIKNEEKVAIKQPYFLKETGADFTKCAQFCHYNALAYVKGEVVFFPELCHGCGGCLLVGPPGSVREKDVLVGKVLKGMAEPGIDFLMGDLIPGNLRTISVQARLEDYINKDEKVILDCPPGTSCTMVTAVKNSDFCILVTEPTPFGLNDLEISLEVLKNLNIPSAVIINREGIGDSCVEDFCKMNNIKILEKIPNDMKIAKAYSKGITIPEVYKEWKKRFLAIIESIEKDTC